MKYLVVLFCVCSIVKSSSQEISVGKYTLDVKEIINRKTITGFSVSVTAKNKQKYVGIKGLFVPKNKKDNRLNIGDFVIKTKKSEYIMTIPEKQAMFYQGANIIKIKKARKRIIIAEVPKEFISGDLYYLGNKIGVIVTNSNKGGTFKPFLY